MHLLKTAIPHLQQVNLEVANQLGRVKVRSIVNWQECSNSFTAVSYWLQTKRDEWNPVAL